jgi:hypothetical protein
VRVLTPLIARRFVPRGHPSFRPHHDTRPYREPFNEVLSLHPQIRSFIRRLSRRWVATFILPCQSSCFTSCRSSHAENYAEIQRVVSEELEDFPYHTLQAQDPHTNFSDIATQQQIANQLLSELRFEVTSIHNVTLRDAWSKVIQGCMEMLPAVEALLLNFTEVGGHHLAMRSRWPTNDGLCANPW